MIITSRTLGTEIIVMVARAWNKIITFVGWGVLGCILWSQVDSVWSCILEGYPHLFTSSYDHYRSFISSTVWWRPCCLWEIGRAGDPSAIEGHRARGARLVYITHTNLQPHGTAKSCRSRWSKQQTECLSKEGALVTWLQRERHKNVVVMPIRVLSLCPQFGTDPSIPEKLFCKIWECLVP